MIICFLVGLVAFGATSSNIPYESGYFIPIHNQVVNNLAELTIALNIEMHSCIKNEIVANHIQTPNGGMDTCMTSENTGTDDVFTLLEPDRILIPR